MSKLTLEDVRHVAKLANLPLTEKEEIKFKEQLSEIISYIDQLTQINTKNITPTSQTTGLINISRNDQIEEENSLTQDEVLSGTEEVDNGYFLIPIVLKEKTI